jgi:hypothetical protein
MRRLRMARPTLADVGRDGRLADFAPLAERASQLDPATLLRLRGNADLVTGFVLLPYEVLAGRTLRVPTGPDFDLTVSAADLLGWLTGAPGEPTGRDVLWLSPLPPRTGWQRLDVVPEAVVTELVRSGAALATSATSRAAQQALLDSVVLRVQGAGGPVEVPLGPVTALTRLGFLPSAAEVAVDTAPGWLRLAAPLGSSFARTGRSVFGLLG